MTMNRNVSPARALDPVSVFTQMLRTSSIIESPSIEAASPPYRRPKPA